MGLFKKALSLLLICTSVLIAEPIKKNQITYLMQAGSIKESIDLYQRYKNEIGKHDFEVLSQMAFILLEQGAKSSDTEKQLLCIFGSGIAGVAASIDVLEAGIKSSHPETQVASIQYLGKLQDDRSDELLLKAMSSDYFQVRLEAAYQLATRKHRASVGQIESLMYRIPPPLRFLFPQFFALIGTADAISALRHLMEDNYISVRIEALLCAGRSGRDDLLPSIRALLTHQNVAEQEAAAYALGVLRDSKSIKKLKKLEKTGSDNVQIAAANALYALGDNKAAETLIEKARGRDLFAIASIGDIPSAADLLAGLSYDRDINVRFNAAMSLLKLRDSRCLKTLKEILIIDTRDLGFQPIFSMGKSQMAWKVVGSISEHQKDAQFDYQSLSLSVREQLLREALELPNQEFLQLARTIFQSKQSDLIPLLVVLLENLHSEKSISLLKEKAQEIGAPLVRGYCMLALFRMKVEGPYEANLKNWLKNNQASEIIRLKAPTPIDQRMTGTVYELSPEEGSRLLIDTYSAFAERHESSSIDLLLELMQNGNPKNLYVLSGLLLRAIQ